MVNVNISDPYNGLFPPAGQQPPGVAVLTFILEHVVVVTVGKPPSASLFTTAAHYS